MSQTSPSQEPLDDGAVDLKVPGSESFLALIRTVVGRAARIAGFTFDGIEDFSLAVDEAAVLLLGVSPSTLRLTVTGLHDGELTAQLSVANPRRGWPVQGYEGDTGWQVLNALCDHVWILEGVGREGIGLSQKVR